MSKIFAKIWLEKSKFLWNLPEKIKSLVDLDPRPSNFKPDWRRCPWTPWDNFLLWEIKMVYTQDTLYR